MQEDASHGAIEHTLHGHTRAITDINFSAHHPDMLATCAVDGYVHCWDLRRPRQPALTFCDWFGGATQVKYNRQDEHILASSHDRWLRIWDDRKGGAPLRSINAHESKIYGVDWNRTRSTGIVTCSLDKSIKFWDYGNELDEPERIIRTDFPVWRARHTPFGWGLLAMPQDTPGELHLYERRLQDGIDKDCPADTVATFPGHGNHKVKEFLWRSRGGVTDDGVDNREFQLVTWGEDNHLRLQNIPPEILEGVGYIKGTQVRKRLNVTRKGATYKTFRTVEHTSTEKKAATITGPVPGSSGLKSSALSAGMKKMKILGSSKAHSIVRAPAMKGKVKIKKGEDQNQKQIDWMSNIKFNKQEPNTLQPKRANTRRLSLNPDFNGDEEWEAPESLPDEIIRIYDKLPKISFDDVNMEKRTLAASMNGPWGDDGNPIYIKVNVTFPEQYPGTKPPTFTLNKTQLMSDQVYYKLKGELQQIANSKTSTKQGCLESALCYLLGEIDLEASTSFLEGDIRDLDDLDALADESSSDDDDEDVPVGASTLLSQELDTSATGDTLGPVNRNVNVPRPRYCGARFSSTGKLVCFFPPKEEKVKSLLETMVINNNARVKGKPLFETFGRLHHNTSPQPNKAYSLASESRSDSDGSDSDESISSDSDNGRFSVLRYHLPEYFRRTAGKRGFGRRSPTMLSQKSSAGGTNTGTGIGSGISKTRPAKPKNLLSIHDISELLPSKMILAKEYAIFGDGPDVCETNAAVAERHGFEGLADVWRYAAMLLHNEVPLQVLDQNHRQEPIFVIAQNAAKKMRRDSGSDSGLDLSYDLDDYNLSGRVKWGTSPLAKDLIQDLFIYFEELADIQMLAMLSCIFSEPIAKDAASLAEHHMPQPQTPMSMKTPAFSLDYFATDAAAWNMYQPTTPATSAISTPKLAHTPSGQYGSVGSSNGAWGSDPASASYSCGETPPAISARGSSEHLDRQAQSLSTSPDNARSFRRANSGLGSFAASLSRPFSLASSSPPNPPSTRKRPSPVENMLGSLAPSVITWGNTTVLGSVKEQSTTARSSYSDDGMRDEWKPTVCTGISITVENQNVFDDEGCMSAALLDPLHAPLLAGYRKAYADLLYLWGHPLARLEILKFNGLKDYFPDEIMFQKALTESNTSNEPHSTLQDPSPLTQMQLGRREHLLRTALLDQGLDATGYCLKHETRLQPLNPNERGGGATGRCERCKFNQRQLRCTVCQEPVVVHYVPCLSCGCVTHRHCLKAYHSTGGSTECSGGCDCDCGINATDGMVESWDVMIDLIRMRNGGVENGDGEEEEEERQRWEKIEIPRDGRSHGMGGAGGIGVAVGAGMTKGLERMKTGDWGRGVRKKMASSLGK